MRISVYFKVQIRLEVNIFIPSIETLHFRSLRSVVPLVKFSVAQLFKSVYIECTVKMFDCSICKFQQLSKRFAALEDDCQNGFSLYAYSKDVLLNLHARVLSNRNQIFLVPILEGSQSAEEKFGF